MESESRVSNHQKRIEEEKQLQQAQEQRLKVIAQHDAEWRKQVVAANKQTTAEEQALLKQNEELVKQHYEYEKKLTLQKQEDQRLELQALLDQKKQQAQEEANIEKQMAADADRIRKESLQQRQLDFQALLDQKTRQAQEEVDQEKRVLAEAKENYKQQLDLQQKLASFTGKEARASNAAEEIRRQLREKEQAYTQYSDAIKQQVAADESIVEQENKLSIALRQQADAEAKIAKDYANKIGERVVTSVGRMELS